MSYCYTTLLVQSLPLACIHFPYRCEGKGCCMNRIIGIIGSYVVDVKGQVADTRLPAR